MLEAKSDLADEFKMFTLLSKKVCRVGDSNESVNFLV